MLPFEFIVDGPPVSQQARRRELVREWKQAVRTAAQRLWADELPSADSIVLTIIYFYDTIDMDVDNIPKPISDALNGLAYIDDKQITDCIVRKRDINNELTFENSSQLLTQRWRKGGDFLYVLVGEASPLEVTGVEIYGVPPESTSKSDSGAISEQGI